MIVGRIQDIVHTMITINVMVGNQDAKTVRIKMFIHTVSFQIYRLVL